MSDLNSVIVRKAYEDFAQGNIPSVFAVFDAGISWHVPGHSPLSGDYTGHDQVGGFFQRTMELSGGAFSMDVHNVPAEDNLVVASRKPSTAQDGTPLRIVGLLPALAAPRLKSPLDRGSVPGDSRIREHRAIPVVLHAIPRGRSLALRQGWRHWKPS